VYIVYILLREHLTEKRLCQDDEVESLGAKVSWDGQTDGIETLGKRTKEWE
jgi:hypothetical protein